MKRILTVWFLLIGVFCFGQITVPKKAEPSVIVGKITPMKTFIAELSYSINPEDLKDTTYSLSFRNMKYETIDRIETVKFSQIDNTFEQLYTVIKSAFLDENKNNKQYSVSFKLGNDMVSVSTAKYMGVFGVMFSNPSGYVVLRESQIDKLFGK